MGSKNETSAVLSSAENQYEDQAEEENTSVTQNHKDEDANQVGWS